MGFKTCIPGLTVARPDRSALPPRRLRCDAVHDEELTLWPAPAQEETWPLRHPQSTHGGFRGEHNFLFVRRRGEGLIREEPCHCCPSASRRESQTCCQRSFFTRSLREWKYFSFEMHFFSALCETITQTRRHSDLSQAEEGEESADGSYF